MLQETNTIPYDSLPDSLRWLIERAVRTPSVRQQPDEQTVFGFLIGCVLAVVIILGVFLYVYSFNYVEGQVAVSQRITERERQILRKYFLYYHTLSLEKKALFEKRLAIFMALKKFRTRGELNNALEAKVLVSAVAIQLSMGLPKFTLPYFRNIFIFPEQYYSRITERYHKGEVNLNGRIVISWKDFIVGMKNPRDGLHVGIHEFAHAFYFENYIENEEFFFIDDEAFKEYFKLAAGEIEKIRKKVPSFIREYAATNEKEFFAVTTEHFFEQPSDMKEKLPELYHALSRVWNQDPVSV